MDRETFKSIALFGRKAGVPAFYAWLGITLGYAACTISMGMGTGVFVGAWLVMLVGCIGVTVCEWLGGL